MVYFTPTDTDKQLVATARAFGREVLAPAELELDREPDPRAVFSDDRFWRVMAQAFDLGFHKMGLREDLGGLGLAPTTTARVWEELARFGPGFSASLMAGSVVPALVAFLAGHKRELVERYVTPYVEDRTGRTLTAWGSSEPDVGSDGKNYYDTSVRHATKAVKRDGRWVLSGTKSSFISNGGIAKAHVVFACVDPSLGIRGSGAFVVPADARGFTPGEAVDRIGLRTLNQAPIYLDEVEVPEDHLLFPPGESYPFLHNSIITVGNLGTGYIAAS